MNNFLKYWILFHLMVTLSLCACPDKSMIELKNWANIDWISEYWIPIGL